ncbi:hypothetical protein Tco_0194294 [Tanacetum coccineum]
MIHEKGKEMLRKGDVQRLSRKREYLMHSQELINHFRAFDTYGRYCMSLDRRGFISPIIELLMDYYEHIPLYGLRVHTLEIEDGTIDALAADKG